jgi:acetaldehyde dehydrogenase/alcohol dehydrogenase
MQAINLIMDALPKAVADGSDLEARTAMSNASTIAGLAFSNAFVGVNHALAHSVGAHFGIPHGRANGIFLPHVLRYNAQIPTKFMPAPGYSTYMAPDKYAQMGWVMGLGGSDMDDRRQRFFRRVDQLLDEVGMPKSIEETGVSREQFDAALPELVKNAFADPSLRTNPRMPMLAELAGLLTAAFEGRPRA